MEELQRSEERINAGWNSQGNRGSRRREELEKSGRGTAKRDESQGRRKGRRGRVVREWIRRKVGAAEREEWSICEK